jgi:hypothetical protein
MTSDRLPWEDAPTHHDPIPLPLPYGDEVVDFSAPGRQLGKVPENYSDELKIQVTLDALKGTLTQRELGIQYGVPQPLVSVWKSIGIQCVRDAIKNPPRRGRKKTGTPHPLDHLLAPADIKTLQRLTNMLRETADLLEQARLSMSVHGGDLPDR